MAAALSRQIPIVEYAPRKVKQVSNGQWKCFQRASSQNADDLAYNKEVPNCLMPTDALAVAVCHHFQNGHDQGQDEIMGNIH
jgi:crossover junction endodeoxyribonuclease RuvC